MRRGGHLSLVVCHAGASPGDVFHASRLPFDPGSPTTRGTTPRRLLSYVEGLWSPRLEHVCRKNCRQKPIYFHASIFRPSAPRVFLSQAGPRFDRSFLTLSITSLVHTLVGTLGGRLSNKKGDPLGRPRLACDAARNLARTPPSESRYVARPRPHGEAQPTSRRRRNSRRGGAKRLGVECGRRHLAWENRASFDKAQEIRTNI